MNISDLTNYRQLCTRGRPASCSRSCPFAFDVSQFLRKIAEKDFSGAYQLYAKAVVFPRIVSLLCEAPCMQECTAHIDIKEMERASINQQADYKLLKLPLRKARIAVTNASLAGMSAALILSQRGWYVDLYTIGSKLGEDICSVLPEQITEADFSIIDKSRIQVLYETQCTNPEEYDYVYEPPVILSVQEIARGIHDAEHIEKALKLKKTPHLSSVSAFPSPQIFPSNNPEACSPYPAADSEILAEQAASCNGCQCTICLDQCAMMKYFHRTPDQLFPDLISTLGLVNIQTRRIAQKHIFSCLSCGLCECPEGIDLQDIFITSRRLFHQEGKTPPAYHEFWLKDLDHADSEKVFVSDTAAPEYLFFPGCQLGASCPENVLRTWEYLMRCFGSVALYSGCCGAPAEWSGNELRLSKTLNQLLSCWESLNRPVLLWTCPNCAKQIRTALPQIQLQSVYELIDQMFPVDLTADSGKKEAAVFDPCAASNMPLVHKAVLSLAQKSGFNLSPSPKIQCCGNGGHIQAVTPEMFEATASDAAFSVPCDLITYCINCRDVFALQGKRASHILDLIPWDKLSCNAPFTVSNANLKNCDALPQTERKENVFLRPSPSWGERRKNRENLKAFINGEHDMEENRKQLMISQELKAKMQKALLLEQEVLETIESCEQTGRKLLSKGPNEESFIGHKQIGSITIWAQWSYVPGGYHLQNVYFHRMTILEKNEAEEGEENG